MKCCTRSFKVLLSMLLMIACILPVNVQAAEETGSIQIKELATNTEQPVAGVKLTLYQVAVKDGDLSSDYQITESFQDAAIDLSDMYASESRGTVVDALDTYLSEKGTEGVCTQETDADGNITFDQLEDGLYFVRQTNTKSDFDELGYTFQTESYLVEIPSADEEGNPVRNVVCQPKGVIQYPDEEETEVIVYKAWKDNNDKAGKRPKEITVGLYAGNTLKEKASLTAENNWMYQWENLDAAKTWTVKEINIPTGYASSIRSEGNVYTITNTLKSDDSTTPVNTGDPASIGIWISLMVGTGILFSSLFLYKKSKRREE